LIERCIGVGGPSQPVEHDDAVHLGIGIGQGVQQIEQRLVGLDEMALPRRAVGLSCRVAVQQETLVGRRSFRRGQR
jgi:hypothetical protein